MSLNTRAMAITFGLLWAGCFLLTGAAHVVWPSYGGGFLEMMASLYPGYTVGGWGSVIVGTLYAAVDGAVCGFLLAWLYNTFAKPAG